MDESIDEYVHAYLKHDVLKAEAAKNLMPGRIEKEQDIMKRIVEGAVLKFRVKRDDFMKLVFAEQKNVVLA